MFFPFYHCPKVWPQLLQNPRHTGDLRPTCIRWASVQQSWVWKNMSPSTLAKAAYFYVTFKRVALKLIALYFIFRQCLEMTQNCQETVVCSTTSFTNGNSLTKQPLRCLTPSEPFFPPCWSLFAPLGLICLKKNLFCPGQRRHSVNLQKYVNISPKWEKY